MFKINLFTSSYFSILKSRALRLAFLLAAVGVFGGSAIAAPSVGELDAVPNVNIDIYPGSARAIAVQPDGKILVGGYFRTVNGIRQKGIARLNADFTLDTTFSADVNGIVYAVALQSDGKIFVGGAFTTIGSQNRNRFARLNANGSLDTTFAPLATGADNVVAEIVVQPDGKILLGGGFTSVNSTNRNGIARLNADGTIDASFVSPLLNSSLPTLPFAFLSGVSSISLQADGKILLGGSLIVGFDGQTPIVKSIIRLNADGALDNSFNAGEINSNIRQVIVQPDGKILAAGSFTLINGVNINSIARFNPDGSLDASFNTGTGPNRSVDRIRLQADGKVLLGGSFSSINGVARNRLARLNADGSLDAAFNPSDISILGIVDALAVTSNGRVLVGGSFFSSFGTGGESNSVRAFNADGSAAPAIQFDAAALGGVRAVAVQTDGKILVGGNFTRPGSPTIQQLFRLKVDGTLDETFALPTSTVVSSSTGGVINSIVIQPDGKILIAGFGIFIPGGTGLIRITSLARLNADGTPDSSFNLASGSFNSGVNAVALQPDGKIVFVTSNGVARVNGDGSADSTFSTTIVPQGLYNSVAVQADGKILVGGDFSLSFVNSQTGSVNYNGIIRLNADGSRDTTFVPAFLSNTQNGRFTRVFAVTLQPDGKILLGGSIFTDATGAPIGAARLNADGSLDQTFNSGAIAGNDGEIVRVEDVLRLPSGKIVIGGFFNRIGATTKNNIARLNADGSLDNSFITSADSTIYDVALQADGKILIGGDFETVNGTTRTSLARLLSEPTTRRTPFDFDGDGKADVSTFRPANGVWYLLNSQNGFTAAQFGASTDKIVPADFDGDGRTDLAVYRNGTWFLNRSAQGFVGIAFGAATDIPAPADFDGDGKSELVVFRPSSGVWYVYNLVTNQTIAVQFGQTGDKPIAADFDGDGKADYAVFRPSNGVWYLNRSQNGFTGIQFGASDDKTVAADYDGDGKTDLAVFRPSNGVWYLNRSTAGFTGVAFGTATDLPTPADYDGDGRADIAVFRPSNGIWYLQRSQSGLTGIQFGDAADKPIPNAFVP